VSRRLQERVPLLVVDGSAGTDFALQDVHGDFGKALAAEAQVEALDAHLRGEADQPLELAQVALLFAGESFGAVGPRAQLVGSAAMRCTSSAYSLSAAALKSSEGSDPGGGMTAS